MSDDNRVSFAEAEKLARRIYEETQADIQRHREEEAKRNHPLYGVHETVKEELAEYAHAAWSGWMAYLFEQGAMNPDGGFTIKPESVARWKRQSVTPYADLPENEKTSDRAEAEKMLAIINSWL